jgi:hypothetical protein
MKCPHPTRLTGVKVLCRRDDGSETWEAGMFWNLGPLLKDKGCSNLQVAYLEPPVIPDGGRRDRESQMRLPACDDAPGEQFALWVPYHVASVGMVGWPPKSARLRMGNVTVPLASAHVTAQTPFNLYWMLGESSPQAAEGGVRLDLCSPDPASLTLMSWHLSLFAS